MISLLQKAFLLHRNANAIFHNASASTPVQRPGTYCARVHSLIIILPVPHLHLYLYCTPCSTTGSPSWDSYAPSLSASSSASSLMTFFTPLPEWTCFRVLVVVHWWWCSRDLDNCKLERTLQWCLSTPPFLNPLVSRYSGCFAYVLLSQPFLILSNFFLILRFVSIIRLHSLLWQPSRDLAIVRSAWRWHSLLILLISSPASPGLFPFRLPSHYVVWLYLLILGKMPL